VFFGYFHRPGLIIEYMATRGIHLVPIVAQIASQGGVFFIIGAFIGM